MRSTRAKTPKQANAGRKTYEQFCPLASALDDVGDRWTLLIVRELLFLGPRRFTDLADALPGIAPNLLSGRLRRLEDSGLVERATLPPPAGSWVYRLTSEGEALREPVVSLMRWGLGRMHKPPARGKIRPEFAAMALEAAFVPAASDGIDATYELTFDGLVLAAHVRDGILRIDEGPAPDPSLRLSMPLVVFARIAVRQLDPLEAFGTGELEVDGDLTVIQEFLRVFGGFGSVIDDRAEP